MKIDRMASVPIVVHDPYLSIWSPADRLYETGTVHWSETPQRLLGHVSVDGEVYRFLGGEDGYPVIRQKSLEVSPTATTYVFEHDKIELTVRFLSPLLLEDPVLVSRPCTYIDFAVSRKEEVQVEVDFSITADLVQNTPGKIIGGTCAYESFRYGHMQKAFQRPLSQSGDRITIDWGEVYLASEEEKVVISYDSEEERLCATSKLGKSETTTSLIIAFDDLVSIFYFGSWQKAYWTRKYETILCAINESFKDKEEVVNRALEFDSQLEARAMATGGADYALLCSISYRHVIGAHKLIADQDGKLVFLSKENDSNGCIGTVDISYPSVPLFLLFDTEYVKAMLRPIFKFVEYPVWEYDFAPHDIGRYPYAAGQVYGLNKEYENLEFTCENGALFPFYYQYPAGHRIYEVREQMPVEESGNMLIMMAAVCTIDGNAVFAEPYYEVLKQWTEYLLRYGADPGEQLCTDDFAGHLSHNVNLAAKAVMGIEAFSRIAALLGKEDDRKQYHEAAAMMAEDWETRSFDEDHYRLAFDREGSWSLKYNLVWDKFFESRLFKDEVFETEISYYLKKNNVFGVPLDNRKEYTKSDWILWCASFAKTREEAQKLIAPVAEYVRNTESRVPFSDWYGTKDGKYCHFIGRSVQGGLYMPILMEKMRGKGL